MEIALSERKQKAIYGREYWIKEKLDNYQYVLVLAGNYSIQEEICISFEKLLCKDKEHVNRQIVGRGLILTVNPIRESTYYDVRIVRAEVIQNILQLYCLYKFTDKLLIGSMEEPYGRDLDKLLSLETLTVNDVVDSIICKG